MCPLFLQQVVEKYIKVFDVPKGMPPPQGHEHTIIFKEGSNPVGVRPYRYPRCQKDEIERLIKEMLAAGIIKPSSSPYLSPVLLVKKWTGLGSLASSIELSIKIRFPTNTRFSS